VYIALVISNLEMMQNIRNIAGVTCKNCTILYMGLEHLWVNKRSWNQYPLDGYQETIAHCSPTPEVLSLRSVDIGTFGSLLKLGVNTGYLWNCYKRVCSVLETLPQSACEASVFQKCSQMASEDKWRYWPAA
jgi:hypothetical protein